MSKRNISIRQCSIADIDSMVKLRRIMFESMGYSDLKLLNLADEAAIKYLQQSIPTGEFIGWIAEDTQKKAIGSGGVVIDKHPPGPNNLSGKKGYIMSVVVVEEFRKQGIAQKIMEIIIQWLKKQNISIANLHATEMGRKLYKKLGFTDGTEMSMKI
ncbi:GNAT family N-acetyltransferase [Candidatus Lokiarchaeum ossiferum]|uniref:GNAT family N-acetyltransferase n=1 Tax=Candidatus Lokiarchaeum ossiferum TaxID=2951803 RepID=UPI00352C9F15